MTPLVDEVVERPEARDVGLRLLDGAVGLAQGLAHRGLAPVDREGMRSEPVHQLVHQDVGEEGFERDVGALAGRQRQCGDRGQNPLEFRLLDVLQHDPLRAVVADDPLVVRQVERGGLHAAIGVAGREHDVDHTNRRQRAQLGVAVVGVDRQVVLEILQLRTEARELRSLGIVADGDERLEGRLVIEPLVLVDLVRADGRLDRRVELHPRHVALVVLVRREGVRAGPQVASEGRLGSEVGGRPQVLGRYGERSLVLQAVRHGSQSALRIPADDGEEAGSRLPVLCGESIDPGRDLVARGVRRIVRGAFRLGRHPGHERPVLLDTGPGSLVHEEKGESRTTDGAALALEGEQQGGVAGPDLLEEQRVHDPSRVDDPRQRRPLGLRQRGDIGADVDGSEERRHGGSELALR